jgi:hypothetical protein
MVGPCPPYQGTAVNDSDFNPGILIGGAAAALSILAALAAFYLWAVNRARRRLSDAATPQECAVIPWLSPLVLLVLVILCLGLVANLAKAYEKRSWPEASTTIIIVMVLMFWLRLHKKIRATHTRESQ